MANAEKRAFSPFQMCWSLVILAALAAGPAALAQTSGACPMPVDGQPFAQPFVLRPTNGVLSTTLVVNLNTSPCLPQWNGSSWVYAQGSVRNYFLEKELPSPQQQAMLPGPTMRVRQTYLKDPSKPPGPDNPIVRMGDQVQVLLKNQLPNNPLDPHACVPATYRSCTVDGKAQVCQPASDGNTGCPNNPTVQCDTLQVPQTSPECFHGLDVTNLHFHGSHTSPQPPHDYVLLNLYSSNQKTPPPPPPNAENAIGEYRYSLDPLPWNQAPGTHWYHPHKHGATAVQILNGMSGAFLVQGPFDDWLYDLYGIDSEHNASLESFEKVMVIQSLEPNLNFFQQGGAAQPTVNGLANPQITMQPGEVQRWRFIAATVNQNFQVQLFFEGFDPNAVLQIAQDGIQFSPDNYAQQPFLTKGIVQSGQTTINSAFTSLAFSPGNRVDILAKAPMTPGTYYVTFNFVQQSVPDNVRALRRSRLAAVKSAAPSGQAIVLTVVVSGSPSARNQLPITGTRCNASPKPRNCFPDLPAYLRPSYVQAKLVSPTQNVPGCPGTRCFNFSMTPPGGSPTSTGDPLNSFWINQMRYQGCCAGATLVVDTAETWYVTNDSSPNHPFHIHINPFLLYEQGSIINNQYVPFVQYTPPIWMDTLGLPPINQTWDVSAGPIFSNQEATQKCPSVCQAKQASWNNQWRTTISSQESMCGCTTAGNGYVKVQSLFADYTGAYVMHCHFLGHEDRGMMLNVQTICQNSGTPGQYGRPQPTLPDNCSITTPALPLCTSATQCSTTHN
jgi:FtsP/CotA-like multicopper oxidase with cupredoxin domain